MNNHMIRSHSTRTDFLLMTMIWTLSPSQNQTCRWNPDRSCAGWIIEFERCWTIPEKMQRKTATNFLYMWRMFVSPDIGSIYFHGKKLLRKFTLHQKYREQSLNETDVEHIWKVDSRIIRWDLWNEYNSLGRFFVEVLTFGWWRKRHQSLAREVYVFSCSAFCFRRMNENPQSIFSVEKNWVCSYIQKIQRFGHNRWWVNGIRVTYFPGFITCISASKSKSSFQKWGISQNKLKDGSSPSMFNDIAWGSNKDNEQEYELSADFASLSDDFNQEDGHSSDLDQKRSGILLMIGNPNENGTESLSWWW